MRLSKIMSGLQLVIKYAALVTALIAAVTVFKEKLEETGLFGEDEPKDKGDE